MNEAAGVLHRNRTSPPPDITGNADSITSGQAAAAHDESEKTGSSSAGDAGVIAADTVAVGGNLCRILAGAGDSLRRICTETDPHFVQVGRDLQQVAREAGILIESLQQTVDFISKNGDEKSVQEKTRVIIQNVMNRLEADTKEIRRYLQQVCELVEQIAQCRYINDSMDRISASFRAVRINIKIQCSTQSISEEMFNNVTDDIYFLSETLTQITKQIKKDLVASLKDLTVLEQTIARNLMEIERVSDNAGRVISKASADIGMLMDGTGRIVSEAGSRSEAIARHVNEVVVSIQFHDSLSQRVDHISHAFDDIAELCSRGEEPVPEEQLGTAYRILDLQHRQLVHIIDEISGVYDRINRSFAIMGTEIDGLNSILLDSQFRAIGPKQFLSSLYTSLQTSLLQLCQMLALDEKMIRQISQTGDQTKVVARRLMNLMEDIRNLRQETRLQAVNTIIMASNLGQQGRTIQVLAKEISSLSDQTSVLVDDVEVLRKELNHRLDTLCKSFDKDGEYATREDLEREVGSIDQAFQKIEEGTESISRQIDLAGNRIQDVRSKLIFLQMLEKRLRDVAGRLEKAKEMLSPWQDRSSRDSVEINQLIERYTMEQERLIHMFDRKKSVHTEQDEDEIFFTS